MRHNKKFNHLSRTASHRSAMLSNMAISLILSEHKRITTTVAKAKELKKFIEPLITRCKQDTTSNRRVVFRYLQNKEAVKELFGEISNKVGDRPGGYTRIIKLGFRQGDAADVCFIELVDYNEAMLEAKEEAISSVLDNVKGMPVMNLLRNLRNIILYAPDKVDEMQKGVNQLWRKLV